MKKDEKRLLHTINTISETMNLYSDGSVERFVNNELGTIADLYARVNDFNNQIDTLKDRGLSINGLSAHDSKHRKLVKKLIECDINIYRDIVKLLYTVETIANMIGLDINKTAYGDNTISFYIEEKQFTTEAVMDEFLEEGMKSPYELTIEEIRDTMSEIEDLKESEFLIGTRVKDTELGLEGIVLSIDNYIIKVDFNYPSNREQIQLYTPDGIRLDGTEKTLFKIDNDSIADDELPTTFVSCEKGPVPNASIEGKNISNYTKSRYKTLLGYLSGQGVGFDNHPNDEYLEVVVVMLEILLETTKEINSHPASFFSKLGTFKKLNTILSNADLPDKFGMLDTPLTVVKSSISEPMPYYAYRFKWNTEALDKRYLTKAGMLNTLKDKYEVTFLNPKVGELEFYEIYPIYNIFTNGYDKLRGGLSSRLEQLEDYLTKLDDNISNNYHIDLSTGKLKIRIGASDAIGTGKLPLSEIIDVLERQYNVKFKVHTGMNRSLYKILLDTSLHIISKYNMSFKDISDNALTEYMGLLTLTTSLHGFRVVSAERADGIVELGFNTK